MPVDAVVLLQQMRRQFYPPPYSFQVSDENALSHISHPPSRLNSCSPSSVSTPECRKRVFDDNNNESLAKRAKEGGMDVDVPAKANYEKVVLYNAYFFSFSIAILFKKLPLEQFFFTVTGS